MSYQVIARKWRPQFFSSLIGQEHVSQTLLNALKSGRLPQVLLFTGPRGTGKTSSARILAKSLRCLHPTMDRGPCNQCRSCLEINSGSAVDVLEIDGASNNGVDEIRRLREGVGYLPSYGTYKIYIIDEVHMLSTSAFNALLKTTEEPPAHVIFILATTEVQKIPSTILSRCQRFDFRRIPSKKIAEHLSEICQKEDIYAESDALWLIARQGDGSMRDSQSLLDQVITYCDRHVTLQKTIEVLGLTDRILLLDALSAVIRNDAKAVLAVLQKLAETGSEPKIFAQEFLEQIRNVLMIRLLPDSPDKIVDLPDSELQALKELGNDLSEEDLHLLFDMTLKSVNDLIRSQDPRLVLEMSLLRISQAPRVGSLLQLLQRKQPVENAPRSKTPAKAPEHELSSSSCKNSPALPLEEAKPKKPEFVSPQSRDEKLWHDFVVQVRESNSLLGAMLENTHLIGSSESDPLQIGVPRKMSFLFDKIKDPENVKRVEAFLQSLWLKHIKVEVKLADAIAVHPASPKDMAIEKHALEKSGIEAQINANPIIRQAQNSMKAQIKDIKEKR